MRNAAGTAVRFTKPRGIRELVFALPEAPSAGEELESLPPVLCTRAAVEGAFVGDFDPDTYRSDRKDQSIQSFTLVAPPAPKSADADKVKDAEKPADASKDDADKDKEASKVDGAASAADVEKFKSQRPQWRPPLPRASSSARARTSPARWSMSPATSSRPPSSASAPGRWPRRSASLARNFSTDKLHELKMGAFWSVSQGSAEPPALIVLRYEPAGVTEGPVLGLVGKGITFDSGGISIKPSDNMEKMKYDMAGGAAMIGAMRAIALLKPKVRVIAIVCAAENMPSGTAQKPGDVQTAMPLSPGKPGKTIEIINTDAEGRLVLADGLTYARKLGATHLIDAATLTGACVVALGYVNAGAFSNDDPTYAKFEAALATSGEKFWRMPLGEEYAEMIKSDIGDIKNTGGRWGGAITAAEFLKVFVEDTPWIHLDIAGMAWVEDSKPYIAKGPSGVGVRSILEWVRSYQL